MVERKQEKVDKYPDLRHKIARQRELRKEEVIPVVIGALHCYFQGVDLTPKKE